MNNNANKTNNPMKVITGSDTRWSYANVWRGQEHQRRHSEVLRFTHCPQVRHQDRRQNQGPLLRPLTKMANLSSRAPESPCLRWRQSRTPLRDGDSERPDDPAYTNAYFINANSATAPGIVDADRNPILTRSEVYSGGVRQSQHQLLCF